MSIGCPVAEAGDLGNVKLNICPDEDVGWVWPCAAGGCGEGEGFRGDWVELSVAAEGESSCKQRERMRICWGTEGARLPTDSCLMLSLEKSMEGLVLSRSASSSSLKGVTLALVGLRLRGVMAPVQRTT